MNKRLVQRISDYTHRVTEMRQKEKERKNKEIVWEFLERTVREAANEGKELFTSADREFDVTVGEIMDAVGLAWKETKGALKDLGFQINYYLGGRNMIAIPEKKSEWVEKLLKECKQMKVTYKKREEKSAKADCKQVLKMLEDGQYDVIGEDAITVKFEAKSDTETYVGFVSQKMKKEGFDITIHPDKWIISVIQEESE